MTDLALKNAWALRTLLSETVAKPDLSEDVRVKMLTYSLALDIILDRVAVLMHGRTVH